METQIEKPTVDKEDKNTQTSIRKEEIIQLGKTQVPFNIQTEISKLKIPIPLIELVKNDLYKSQITETLNISEGEDFFNQNDDQPELLFAPEVNGKHQEGGVPPFYISLSIHDQILHNVMLDSRESTI